MDKNYLIQFSGLKIGIHKFEFDLDKTFFDLFDYENDFESAELHVDIELEIMSTMLTFNFVIDGNIVTSCDRCMSPMNQEIFSENTLYAKFGDEENLESGEDVITLYHGEYEVNLSKFIFEYIITSIPQRVIHSSIKECDQDVVKKLEELKPHESQPESNPTWDALKNLNNN